MKIITISGLDGSGKSTQIKMLKKYLESQGKKVFYFHVIQNGIVKKFGDFRRKYCILCRIFKKCKTGSPEKSVTSANWFQIILRRIFLMVDLLRFKSLKNKLSSEGYDSILSDRYFYDTIINLRYLAKSDKNLPCEKFIIKPDASIYLKTNPEIIMQRERKPDQDLKYLQAKNQLYNRAAFIWNMKIIDGNRSKEEIFKEIKNYL